MTGSGIVVYLVMFALKYFNITGIDESQISTFIADIGQVAGFVLLIVGQIRRKDVSFGIIKKY